MAKRKPTLTDFGKCALCTRHKSNRTHMSLSAVFAFRSDDYGAVAVLVDASSGHALEERWSALMTREGQHGMTIGFSTHAPALASSILLDTSAVERVLTLSEEDVRWLLSVSSERLAQNGMLARSMQMYALGAEPLRRTQMATWKEAHHVSATPTPTSLRAWWDLCHRVSTTAE